ncbi:MAG TPA: alpha-glucosidase/alpha-galactosidase [Thermomicrobiales bacterium]|nr:alpha-glucosidase/alpha-galactosidase [Thermomicrobiales bacterium]
MVESTGGPKVTLVGAGSTVFAKNLIGDILSYPELSGSTIALFDIDDERLKTSEIVAKKLASSVNAPATIVATTDRKEALRDADYVIIMIQVGGYKPSTVIDFEIPKKYGLRQTIADTLGIGGIFRALRTIPVLIDVAKDMEEVCPNALFLNYVNPMAMNCWAISRASDISTVGLCHSVQGTAGELARDIDVPVEEINYIAAGINHYAFYLKFERDGVDLYPEINKVIAEGRVPDHNRVRYEMLKRTGYFVTESSEHFSEYGPWFIKRDRPDLIEQFNIPLDEYIRRCEEQLARWGRMRAEYEGDAPIEHKRSHEYASRIILGHQTGNPEVIYGNVPNHGLIDNLPDGCCVEVPILVDRNGLQPTTIGSLPPQLAAMMQTNINVQALTVEAAITKKREHIYHAAMLDPHTAAELDLDQIWHLVDDLIEAHGDWLPTYS